MKKLTKSIVAILALVAMLTQNAYGVYAAATSPQPILVDNEFADEASDPVIEVVTEDTTDNGNSEEGTEVEYADGELDVDDAEPTDDVNYDDEIMLLDEESEESYVPEELDILETQISGAGLTEFEVFIDTEKLEIGDSFRVIFTGPEDARYDTRLNDDLDTTSQGVYRFVDLNKEGFNLRATTNDNVRFEYTSEDGRPVIKAISVESDEDKLLFVKSIEDKNDKPITAIKGEGYRNLSIKIDSEKLDENAEYKLYVDTEADVKINNESTDSITGTKSLENIELSNLNKESFVIYVVGNEGFEVDSNASIVDVTKGEVKFALESVATKTVYEYEDANVYVKATLQKADAIPDDAYFCVELVKDSEAEEYIDLMNKEAGEEDKYTDDNTLVYDISFYTDETKSEVIEPEEGSVTVSIEFKKKQISEELGAEDDEEIEITHFEEHGNDVDVVVLEDASIDATSNEVEFVVDSFSKFAITYNGKGGELAVKNPGSETTKGLLGDNIWLYGVVANEWTQTEAETSFAVKKINASAQTGTNSDKAVGSNHQYCMVADVNGELHIKGFDADLVTTTAAKSKILHTDGNSHLTVYEKSKSEIETDIDNMLAKAQATANRIVGLDSVEDYSKAPKSDGENGHLYIDITSASSGTYYIDMDKWPSLKTKFAQTGQVHIKKNKDQKIVFYSKDSNVAFRKFDVANGSDHYEDSNTIANHSTYDNPVIEDIIFVVPGKSNVTLDGVAGVFIMPQATVTLGNTSGGWLACDNFTNGAGEWHFTNGHLPSPEDANAEFDFLITKELVGGEWPANGFTFELKRHMPVDGVDDSSNNDAKNSATKSPLPDKLRITIPGNGSETQSASFGKIKFVASDIWVDKSGDVAANGIISKDSNWYWKDQPTHNTYDKVMDQMYMYEIREVSNPKDPSIVYDTEPWYLKINVHVAKEYDTVNKKYRFVIWYDAKTDRSVLPVEKREDKKLECMNIGDQPIRFVNTCKPSVVLEGEKTINGDGTNVPSGKFEFSLYEYDRSNNFKTKAKQTVKNNGNKFTFDSINLDYNACTTYCAADGTVLNGIYWDKELREKAAYGYTYFLIKETKCDALYEVQHKVLARVKIAKKYAKEAGKDVFKGYDTSVTYFRYGVNDPTDINNLNNGGHIMTFDNKYESVGYIRFNAFKQMANANVDNYNGKFSFKISTENDPYFKDSKRGLGNEVVTNHADENGKDAKYVTFDTLEYDQDDIAKSPYIYHIKEVIPADADKLPGVTYDETDYKIVVYLSDNNDGSIKCLAKVYKDGVYVYEYENSTIKDSTGLKNRKAADEQPDSKRPVFVNTYSAKGQIVLSATKAFRSATPLVERDYTFVLKEGDKVIDTKSVTGTGTVSFDAIKYALTPDATKGEYGLGEHTYTITESRPTGATAENNYTYQGVVYDPTVYTVVVNATNNGQGNVVTTINGEQKAAFGVTVTNDYKVTETKIPVNGKKVLKGMTLEANKFTFKLEAADTVTADAITSGAVVLPSATSVQNDADGNFSFGNIIFKATGDYSFKVTEDSTTKIPGVQYSTDVYEVLVSVTDVNGQLTPAKTVKLNNGNVSEIKFTNYYAENGINLEVNKKLTGKTLAANQFDFVLKDEEGNVLQTKKNDGTGKVSFDKLTYKLTDLNGATSKLYTYYINEVTPDKDGNGYEYDRTIKTANVTVTKVTDAEGNVSLDVAATYVNNDNTFINTYKASGKVKLDGAKELVGRKFTAEDNGKFKAVLLDANDKVLQTVDIVKDTSLFGEKGGKFEFDYITYDTPGTYTYKVKETGSATNVTNDTTIYTVVVSVVDNEDGTLTATPVYKNGETQISRLKFTNTYNADGGANIKAVKSLKNGTLEADKFNFELFDVQQNKVIQTKGNAENGTVTFDPITYKLEQLEGADSKVFKYTISEKNEGKPGYTYSTKVYNVEVTVTNNGGATLGTTVVYKDGEVVLENAEFENEYNAVGKVQLKAKKVLNGRAMEARQFAFELLDENGTRVENGLVPSPAAAAGEEAEVLFPEWTFTQDDLKVDALTHATEDGFAKYYTIREVVPANVPSGYTYDERVYNVIVTLKDDGKGKIETDWLAYEAGKTPEKPSVWDKVVEFFTGKSASKNVKFVNEYVAEGQVVFSAHKVVKGAELSSFEFNLSGKAEDGSNINQTLESDANGNVVFSPITYTKPTEAGKPYVYTIKEVIPTNKKPGYKYDETEHIATVTVTDDGSGVLSVSTVLDGKTKDSVVTKKTGSEDQYGLCTPDASEFVNEYSAEDTSITVGGTKTLTGKKLVADEFSFNMVSADGNPKAYNETVKNDANGDFSFPAITYTFADMKNAGNTYATTKEFAYVVTEVEGDEDGVEYSTASYNVVVEVTNANGKLSTKLLVNDLDKTATPLEAVGFTNTYNVNGETSLKVTKFVTGKDKSDKNDDIFTFNLLDANDTVIASRSIKANEEAVFSGVDELKYDLNDLVKQTDGSYSNTFTYKVVEEPGTNAGFKYSEDVYDVSVEVTSSTAGVMTINKTITKASQPASEPMVFTNDYTADGSVAIEGEKIFTSKNALADNEFTFVLEDVDGNELARVGNGHAINVKTGVVTAYSDNNETENFKFVLDYDQSQIGTYDYVVREIVTDVEDRQIKFDSSVYDVQVAVADNGDGTLACTKVVSTGNEATQKATFHNFEVDENEVVFTAEKRLTGMTLANNMFTFTLKNDKGVVLQTMKNQGTKVSFDAIPYTLADLGGAASKTFTYKIEETVGTNKGITYSDELYTAVVTVSYADGTLSVSKSITNKAGTVVNSDESDGMVFNNTYASKTKVRFGGEKILEGFDKRAEANKETYTFELYDAKGSLVDSQDVTGAGKFRFDEIEYSQDDYNNTADHKIYYTVKELVQNKQQNVTYDDTIYHVVVELGYNADGTLKADVSTTEGVNALDYGLEFTNSYAAEGTVPFKATKTVTGTNLGEYTFEFYEGDSETPSQTVTNSGNNVTFNSITYNQDQIGTYTYYIKEKAGDVTGMTYDTTVYKIVVTVADQADGSLSITKKTYVVGEDGDEQVSDALDYKAPFKNEYVAKGETKLEGTKILENRAIKDTDKFTFVLKDASGTEIDRVVCGTDGKFTFEGDYFKYDQEALKNGAGSYDASTTKYFTVEEVKGNVAGVEYSDAVYAVSVSIEDNKNGTLKVEPSVMLTNASAKTGFAGLIDSIKSSIAGSKDALEFTNTYKAEGQWDPEGYKELVGKKLEDGDFTFKIMEVDQKGKLVGDHEYTVENDGNIIKFSSDDVVSKKGDHFLKYSIDDLDPDTHEGYYLYKFSEVKQKDNDGVKYDETVYSITVKVSDNGDGTLKVEVNKDNILPNLTQKIKDANLEEKLENSDNLMFLFYNEYNASGKIDLLGTKVFDGPDDIAEGFKFQIKETTEGAKNTTIEVGSVAEENGVRVVKFENIAMLSYSLNPSMKTDDTGIHTYEIREFIPADANKAPGVKYDEKIYTVTIDVKDDENGKLIPEVTSVTRELNGGAAKESFDFFVGSETNRADYFSFTNEYKARGEVVFRGTKYLKQYEDSKNYITGDELKQYQFKLIDATTGETLASANPDENGNYILGLDSNKQVIEPLKYTQKDIGTKQYKIVETEGNVDGVVYDKAVYDVTVNIADADKGSDRLKISVTYKKTVGTTVGSDATASLDTPKPSEVKFTSVDEPVYLHAASSFDFTNYKPEYVVLSGKKHWVGGPANATQAELDNREVTINLYASNVGVGGTVINSAKVNAASNYEYKFSTMANGKKLPAYTTTGERIIYRVEEVEVPGYLSEKYEVVPNKVYDFYNTYGELLIKKVDAITGDSLAGAELAIIDASGNEVDRWVSGTSAHVVDVTKVKMGATYTLREINAPAGYKVAPDQTFEFKKGETTVVTMEDTRIIGSVRLRKLDATTRDALSGAEFALYRADGTRIYASGTSGSYRYSERSSNGRFAVNGSGELTITDLPYGSYYFTEIEAPVGYVRSTERFAFSVLDDGAIAEVTALNTKEVGSVRLRKTNADGSVPLAGAVFELYAKTPSSISSAIASTIYADVYYRVGTYTTGASGVIEVGDLPWDDYYFVEVQAPAGYEVNTDVNGDPIAYTFTIGSTGTAYVSYDLGRITNSTTPPTPPSTPPRGGEVRGERKPRDSGRRSGGVLSGVLGVRAAPKAGVLGERLGPVTGDAFNIFLWTLLLLASVGAIVAVAIANVRRKRQAR